jgi:hypothetical protein
MIEGRTNGVERGGGCVEEIEKLLRNGVRHGF